MIISNSFFVQVIEDGSSLRGEIRSTAPLAQSFNGGSCVPNWTPTGTNNPIVYIVLQNGARWELPDNNYTWYYNNAEIEWDSNGKSLAHSSGLPAGTFEKVSYRPDMYTDIGDVPAIKIAKNLASSDNVDIDVIRFQGQKTLATNPVTFSASIDVAITEIMQGGYMGLIYLAPGTTDKDISSKTDTVGLIAHLYDSEGNEVTTAGGAKYRWLINEVQVVPDPTTHSGQPGTVNTLTVTEAMIYDYGIVKCEFYLPKDNGSGTVVDTVVSTDFLEIDDTQDPQEMYFAYNGANGKSASLRQGESVTFSMWIADAGNPDRTANPADTQFSSWKVMLVDSNKQTLTQDLSSASLGGYPAADANGYRALSVSNGVATAPVPFALAALTAGGQSTSGGIRGYVIAQTSNS